MAHDRPAERSAPAKRGKTTALGKGADPDDGVVTPEAALCTRPPDQPCGRYRPIESCGDLLPAAAQARAAGGDRRRLDQAHGGVGAHPTVNMSGRPSSRTT